MLEVIYGPMFSGKTEELIRRLRRAEIGGKRVIAYKPAIDERYGIEYLTSHNGSQISCVPVQDILLSGDVKEYDVIGIDEAQFFHRHNLLEYLDWNRRSRELIVAGLNLNYRQESFGAMQDIINCADKTTRLNAVCHKCKNEYGIFTQRLTDGFPSGLDEPEVVVGGLESYEARCWHCYNAILVNMEKDCKCNGKMKCSKHFMDGEDYRDSPQYHQQYGGPKNAAGIGWKGNCLGVVKGGRDNDES